MFPLEVACDGVHPEYVVVGVVSVLAELTDVGATVEFTGTPSSWASADPVPIPTSDSVPRRSVTS